MRVKLFRLSRCLGPPLIAWLWCATLGDAAPPPDASPPTEELFERHVRPLLVQRCHECHGPDSQWAGLRLDSPAGLQAGGDGGPAVRPGDAAASLLYQRLASDDPDFRMPPPEEGPPLSPEQLRAVAQWIDAGAAWPAPLASEPPTAAATSHWAFQPVRRPALPAVRDVAWIRTPIDRFVLARLDAAGLEPSPEADRATLVRRVTYDLTGLPPTADEVAAFVHDARPDAYEALIDRLLDSPRYGEHWGRHWLDVARYSDAKGYVDLGECKQFVHSAHYRDWVIRAFQEDLPYDRFVMLQLAADQAAPDDPAALAAMGFLTLGRRFLGNAPDILDDRIDVIARGLLGLTVGCARCHDHKYDPIPTQDYYSLYGVLQNSLEQFVPLPRPADAAPPSAEFVAGLAEREQAQRELVARERADAERRLRERLGDYLLAQRELDKYPEQSFVQLSSKDDLLPGIVRRWEVLLKQAELRGDPVFAAWIAYARLTDDEFAAQASATTALLAQAVPPLNRRVAAAFRTPPASAAEAAARYRTLLAEIETQWSAACEAAAADQRPAPTALEDPADEQLRQAFFGPTSPCVIPDESIVHTDYLWDFPTRQALWKAQTELETWLLSAPTAAPYAVALVDRPHPIEAFVFRRGDPARKGEAVPRQFLAALAGAERRPFAVGSGRLELAQAIASPANPLTARVWVNRLWLHHFGAGLVATPSDFGLRAAPPSHPELLDWLAARLVEHGWRTKPLHREILLSAAYRQSSLGPADAEALARAEQIDPENRLLWRAPTRRLTFEQLRDSLLAASGELDLTVGGPGVDLFSQRRSVYVAIDRQFLPPVLSTFDVANPNMHAPQRVETTTAMQALFALNHPFVAERAQRLAARCDADPQGDAIAALYRAVLSREPDERERRRAAQFLSGAGPVEPHELAPLAQLAQALLLSNEFMFID